MSQTSRSFHPPWDLSLGCHATLLLRKAVVIKTIKHWQHAVPQSTGHFRRPCEAISCDNVKAFSVRNPFVFYLSTIKTNNKKIQKTEEKISFKADELITANNETQARSNSERNIYNMLSNISKGTAILHQEVASCGFRKLVRK